MTGDERREKILDILKGSSYPVAGVSLANQLKVSRQVIVQDIALLRANGTQIMSTNKGYLIQQESSSYSRVFKVYHTDEETEEELTLIVDLGGRVKDVFVYHKTYGVVKAELNIKSRMDITNYLAAIAEGKSTMLKNVTSNYHYHTIYADSEKILDIIQEQLQKRGFLAKLQDYEPVDFWAEE